MANRRTLTWSSAMRDVRGERRPRAGIREERLRATAGLGSSLSTWQGASGRRYVVGIQPLTGLGDSDVAEAVVIAVRRGSDGMASVVDVAAPGPGTTRRARLRWLALMRTRGATEMHVHLLAEDEAEREAVRRDLVGDGGADAVPPGAALTRAGLRSRPGSGR